MGELDDMDHMHMDNMETTALPEADADTLGGYMNLSIETIIFFLEWTTKDWQTLLFSSIGLGILAVILEAVKCFRSYLIKLQLKKSATTDSCCTGICTCLHIFQTFLYIIQVTISYALMLVFMTFNGWLCIAVLVGAGVGYLIFGWKADNLSLTSDQCH